MPDFLDSKHKRVVNFGQGKPQMAKIGKRIGEATKSELKGLQLSAWDIKNIQYLISFYERAYPGVIKMVAKDARKDIIKERKLRALVSTKDKLNLSRRMTMPNGLLQELKRAYPAIVSDKRQFEAFLKAFPQFDLYQ